MSRAASDPLAPLRGVVDALAFHDDGAATWHGRPFLPAGLGREHVLPLLSARLYERFYCTGRALAEPPAPPPPGPSLVDRLREANGGVGPLEGGWRVRVASQGVAVVERHGMEILVRPQDCEPSSGLAPGDVVRVRVGKEALHASPGFYLAYGDSADDESRGGLVRVYWHVTPRGAVRLMRKATRELNALGVPFRLKVLVEPATYGRADSGVLYFRRPDAPRILAALPAIHAEVAADMRDATPAFTRRLAPGLALAEDPGGDESFGQHRCRLVAEGLLDAHDAGAGTPEARLDHVRGRLSRAGLDLASPWLSPGSAGGLAYAAPPIPPARAPGREDALRLAVALGERLAREAFWSGDACAWLTAVPEEGPALGKLAVRHVATGPDLYDGTAGIALFLAELAALTRHEAAGRVALGAARHALARADAIEEDQRRGLHGGWGGVGLALLRVGRLLGRADVAEGGLSLLRRLEEPAEGEPDVLAGTAGAVLALLAAHREAPDDRLLATAARLGDALLRSARVHEDGTRSWASPAHPLPHDLTGYSHGAAGIGHALFELHAATGEPRFAQAAREAFRYEARWYDETRGLWRDLRGGDEEEAFGEAWCHGTPGIALARLRAHALTGHPEDARDAERAVDATRRHLRGRLEGQGDNLSLCHGLCGDAEVLLDAGPFAHADDPKLLAQVVRAALDVHEAGEPIPCGVPEAEPAGLMTGLAGIGRFHLRYAFRDLPSVLAPRGGK